MRWILVSALIVVSAIVSPTMAQAEPKPDVFRYYTPDLKTVDQIDLYLVRTHRSQLDACTKANAKCVGFGRSTFSVISQQKLVGAKAQGFVNSLLQIEGTGVARCFSPNLIFNFYSQKRLVLSTLVCFGCGRAQLLDGSIIKLLGGNTASEEAFETLLEQMRALFKDHPQEFDLN